MVTWYVAFQAHTERSFLVKPFLHKGFKHCFCFRNINPHLLVVDPTGYNINASIVLDTKALEYAIELVKTGGFRVLRYGVELDDIQESWHVGNVFPTCVTIVKMMIGINTMGITPYSLYKRLLKMGARVV